VDAATIETIERATVEGVAPSQTLEIDGWLVPMDQGSIGRAKSATPLSHHLDAKGLSAIEAAYWTEGLSPAFRVAEVPGLLGVREALTTRGYVSFQPTLMKVGDVARLATFRDVAGEVLARPDDAWRATFAGEGFDPVDAASRVAAFSRSPDVLFGAAREDGRILAVGVVTFAHGWAGIHGMRTVASARGRGLASQVLTALGRAAVQRGIDRVFLQVEEPNPARSLYRKAGFVRAWTYRYWNRP
jgi:ribosomal protein S18 acetylase RimI-like enzyme